MKIDSEHWLHGDMRQKYLASAVNVVMRLWEDAQPDEPEPEHAREYESVGHMINGRAEPRVEGQMVLFTAGGSWVVLKGAAHTYTILEPLTAIEATTPPAHADGRDNAVR